MTPAQVESLLYLSVNYITRLKKLLRCKMADDERVRLQTLRERMWALADACEAVLAGKGDAALVEFIGKMALPVAKIVESYVEHAGGRSMQYRLKAHIRTVRGEAEEKRKDDGEVHGGAAGVQ